MWQLYVLGSLFANAGEYVTDKVALFTDKRIDTSIATFWRMFFFVVCASVIGWIGFLGNLSVTFTPLIVLVGLIGIGNSFIYTTLLRKIEITGIGAISYLAPFIFLLIDMKVLHTQLSGSQITGIFLMVLGGFAFAVDGKTHHFKREYSPQIWFMLFYMVFYVGVEAYSLKLMNAATGISAPSFFVSTGIIATIGIFAIVVLRKRTHLLFKKPALVYIPRVVISKTFDALETILWGIALTLAAVSQVSAMEALEPLVLFAVTVIVQDVFRFRAGEKLGRSRVRWKAVAVSMLVVGGLLVS
jgi:drug/metabolite transporter (DMT)-like permease